MTDLWEAVDADELERLLALATPDELQALTKVLTTVHAHHGGKVTLLPHQVPPRLFKLWLLMGGRGCLAAGTPVWDPIAGRSIPIEERTDPGWVLALTDGGPAPAMASRSYRKGRAMLYEVRTATGDVVRATAEHRFLTPSGWAHLRDIAVGSLLACGTPMEWRPVTAIEPVGVADFYDLTVPGPANYLAADMWHHNSGKTQACAAYLDEHAMGPPCHAGVSGGHRMAIVAPTLGDALDACVNGPSGLKVVRPEISVTGGVDGTIVRWPNGSAARLFGTNSPRDIERLRAGGGRCASWWEELAAWPNLAEGMTQSRLGTRLGWNPRIIASTTPKNRPEIKALVAEAEAGETGTFISTGSTYDNPHLDETTREGYRQRYEGTRVGEQELHGKLLGDLGDVFKGSWFANILPESPAPDRLDGTGWKRVRYWDLAATEAPETTDAMELQRLREQGINPDWTAGARVAWHQESRHLVIEHMRRVRRTPAGVEAVIAQTAAEDGRGLPVRMEQEGGSGGPTTISSYRRGILSGFDFDGISPKGDKVTRARVWANLAEQGRVTLVDGDWVRPFVDECEEFTVNDRHDHDDMIDAVSGAVQFLFGPQPRRGGLRA